MGPFGKVLYNRVTEEAKNMKLWLKILIGLIAGVAVGSLLGAEKVIYIKPIGTLFINAIKMLIVLFIFASLVVGITSISDPKKMGRIGIRAIGLYLLTTFFAISIGLGTGLILKPGTTFPSVPGTTAPERLLKNMCDISDDPRPSRSSTLKALNHRLCNFRGRASPADVARRRHDKSCKAASSCDTIC